MKKLTLTVATALATLTMATSVFAYSGTVDTAYKITMPENLVNGKGTVSTTLSGDFKYEFVEIDSSKYTLLKQQEMEAELIKAFVDADTNAEMDTKYNTLKDAYEAKYNTTVAKLYTDYGGFTEDSVAASRSTWIHSLPNVDESKWVSSASKEISMDLTTFEGTKYVVAWVQVGDTKDAEAYVVTGTKTNEPEATKYTVTFKDYDGKVLSTQTVVEGQAAVKPENPTRDGYTFTGWDKDFSKITSDLVVTAQYSKNAEEEKKDTNTIVVDNTQKEDTTKASNKIPQTGVDNAAIVSLMSLATLGGAVSYIKYRKIK